VWTLDKATALVTCRNTTEHWRISGTTVPGISISLDSEGMNGRGILNVCVMMAQGQSRSPQLYVL